MFNILLQEPAMQEGGAQAAIMQFLPLLLIIVVFYFFMIRPQQNKQKELDRMRSELKKGDSVVTTSGLIAKIAEVKEDRVILEIQNGVCATFDKAAIMSVNKK